MKSPGQSGLRLLTLLTVVELSLAAAGLLACSLLMVSTTRLERLASRLASAVESVYAADQAQRALLLHGWESRLSESANAAGSGAELDRAQVELARWFGRLEELGDSSGERELLVRARESAQAYLGQREALEPAGRTPNDVAGAMREAQAALGTLVELNFAQSQALQREARSEDRLATWLGLTAAAVVLLLLGVAFILLHRELRRPLVRLKDEMALLEAGNLATLDLEGPAELREIAHVFNGLIEQLQQHRQTQLRFLAGIAHDLRTPLNAMKLSTALIDGDNLDAEQRETLQTIDRQISQLDRQVGDLLDTTRIESGQLELRMTEQDMRQLVENAAKVFRGMSSRHTIRVITPTHPVVYACDGTRIGQVLNNLLSNAIKYSPSGGEIEVTLAAGASELALSVRDQGIGISADDVNHVFEPFRRTAATREAIPGVGLGLSVARRIAEAHGGSIIVRSVPAAGSTFTLVLPLKPVPADPRHAAAGSTPLLKREG